MADWFTADMTPDQAKKLWRELSVKHHPDKGGDAETFKKIANEWAAKWGKNGEKGFFKGPGAGTTGATGGATTTKPPTSGTTTTKPPTTGTTGSAGHPNPGRALPQSTSTTPATTPKPTSNLPATQPKPGSNLPATRPPATTTTPTVSAAPKVNVGGAAMGAVGVVTGAVGMYESVKEKDTKATWGDVGTGAMSGVSFAAGTAAIVNAIPGVGQIAYGGAIVVGAVVGSAGAGAKMFSETDCSEDPILGGYACCNISFLSNIKARRVGIGGEMFCDEPGKVRQCVQGSGDKKRVEPNGNFWKNMGRNVSGLFLDDYWEKDCRVKYCNGWARPEANASIEVWAVTYGNNDEKACWAWECAGEFKRAGNKCAPAADENESAQASEKPTENKNTSQACVGKSAGSDCATNGSASASCKMVNMGQSGEALRCVAASCRSGFYRVHSAAGNFQGWCNACPVGSDKTNCQDDNGKLKCPGGAAPQISRTGGAADTCPAADSNAADDATDAGADDAATKQFWNEVNAATQQFEQEIDKIIEEIKSQQSK